MLIFVLAGIFKKLNQNNDERKSINYNFIIPTQYFTRAYKGIDF